MKAIDTYHNGRLFRSRLEARWAVFFEALGVRYDYEPEGFRFDDGTMYLPDFWLPEQKFWVEIKATGPTPEELRKAEMLAAHSVGVGGVYVFHDGLFLPPRYEYPEAPPAHAFWGSPDGHVVCDFPYHWCECEECGFLGVEFDGRAHRLPCCSRTPGMDKGYNHDSPRLIASYQAAMSARFEHEAREVPGFETVGSVVQNLKRGARIGGAVRRGEAVLDATPRQEGDQTA